MGKAAEEAKGDELEVCAICQQPFRHVRDYERFEGKLYHRACARKANLRHKFRGITFSSKRGKWLAYIATPRTRFGPNQRFRGPFETEYEAAQAYNTMALEMYGDEAVLNVFDDDPPPPTEEEIAAACEAIRSGWTDYEYAQRAPHLAPLPVPAFDEP